MKYHNSKISFAEVPKGASAFYFGEKRNLHLESYSLTTRMTARSTPMSIHHNQTFLIIGQCLAKNKRIEKTFDKCIATLQFE